MAYELWSGGNISGGADATSWSLKPRGGYVPLADIPNVPKTVDMPMLQYPKMPSIRYEPVKGEVDMESRAAKLMQKELPGSFEEAGNIRAAEAGKGQMAMGKAIASVGADISKAMGSVSEVLGKFVHQGLKDKDEADQHIFANNIIDYEGRRNEIYQTLPPDQWPDALATAGEDLSKKNAGLGVFPRTRDNIQSKTTGYIRGTEWGRKIETAKKMSTDAINLYTSEIADGRATNDIDMMNRGVAGLEAGNHITHEQAQHEYDLNNTRYGIFVADQAIKTPGGSREVMEDAKLVVDGGKAQTYDVFNKNPALAPNYLVEAQESVRRFKAVSLDSYKEKLATGEIKDDAGIEQFGKDSNWSDATIKAAQANYRRELAAPDPAKLVEYRTKINEFDPATDPSGEKYTQLYMEIDANIDKGHRDDFIRKLKTKQDDRDKPHSAQKAEHAAFLAEAKDKYERGLLVPSRLYADFYSGRAKEKEREQAVAKYVEDHKPPDPGDKKKTDKYRAKIQEIMDTYKLSSSEGEAKDTAAKTMSRLQSDADEYLEKHPDFKPGELGKELMGEDTEAQKRIQENAGKSASVQRATPVAGREQREVPTDEQLASIQTIGQLNLPVTGPRDMSTGGSGNPQWQAAFSSGGPRHNMRATAYTKHEPGGNQVKGRDGPLFTIEKYQRGLVPYVSVAMDDDSDLQGKYLVSSAHPNVVFKVEDRGGAFVGKGNTAIDIAFDNRRAETEYESNGTWKVISAEEAARVNGTAGLSAGNAPVKGVHPELLARLAPIQQQFGKLDITSGYRDPGHNERVGGAGDSEHTRGDAVDIRVVKMSIPQRIAMIEAAHRAGMQGIGVYNNTLHFDLGFKYGKRAWGPSHGRESIPSWARPTLTRLGYVT